MLLRRLSQTLGQIKKGYAVDTFEGGFPITQVTNAPSAKGADDVLASTALTAAAQVVTAGVTDPDAYRVVSVVGNQASVYGVVTVLGSDWAGRKLEENITVSGTGTVIGNKAFKTVNQVTLPVLVAAGDEVSVGVDNKLGLYRTIVGTALTLLEADNVAETEAAIDTTNDTYTPTTAPNGSVVFKASYLTDIF